MICLRLSDLELSLLDDKAEKCRLTRSDFIRSLILNRKLIPKYQIVIDSKEIRSLLAQYGKIGSNLNQIAKYFNTGGERSLAMQEEIQQIFRTSILCEKRSYDWQVILLAIIKHVKSHNANYSNVMDYLLFQHDPKTGVLLHNDLGQRFFREDFYKDGLNCNPDTFDIECRETNEKYKKNRRREEVKNHHYIISFDPDDVTECGLTGERAQELCMDFVRKNFPGYQAIVVTHTDGDNHSGNIHTHIVINSVRKYAVERQDYMDKPNEEKAGYKHRSTNRFLTHLKKEVMAMCEREGLHQIDLLSPSPEKITEAEFRAKSRGQEKMDKINKKITAEGLRPSATTFQTQKISCGKQ